MKRYALEPAEAVRKAQEYTIEQFSVMIGFSPLAYRAAIRRGYLTRAMALEISNRFDVPLDSQHVDAKPHMSLRLPGPDEYFLEMAEPIGLSGWFCWLRSDMAGLKGRFIHLRHIYTRQQLARLYLALTDAPLKPVEHDPIQFKESLARERQDCQRRYQEYCRKERYSC